MEVFFRKSPTVQLAEFRDVVRKKLDKWRRIVQICLPVPNALIAKPYELGKSALGV